MNKTWKLVLLLTGIFLAGGAAGSFLMLRFGRQFIMRWVEPDQWTGRHLDKLTHKLGLTPAQVDELRPIVRKNMEELGRQRSESMAASRSVMERMEKEVAARLTPEQKVKFDAYIRERRERMLKATQQGRPPERREGRPAGERPPEAPSKPREPGS